MTSHRAEALGMFRSLSSSSESSNSTTKNQPTRYLSTVITKPQSTQSTRLLPEPDWTFQMAHLKLIGISSIRQSFCSEDTTNLSVGSQAIKMTIYPKKTYHQQRNSTVKLIKIMFENFILQRPNVLLTTISKSITRTNPLHPKSNKIYDRQSNANHKLITSPKPQIGNQKQLISQIGTPPQEQSGIAPSQTSLLPIIMPNLTPQKQTPWKAPIFFWKRVKLVHLTQLHSS